MSILIDSANLEEIKTASEWGWVQGVTTNPALMALNPLPSDKILAAFRDLIEGPIFYQPHSLAQPDFFREAELAHSLLGDRLVLKIPATPVGFRNAARLTGSPPCCITALYSPGRH